MRDPWDALRPKLAHPSAVVRRLVTKEPLLRQAMLLSLAILVTPIEARADGTYLIYGTHFYGTGEEQGHVLGGDALRPAVHQPRRRGGQVCGASRRRDSASSGASTTTRGRRCLATGTGSGATSTVRGGQIARDMAGVASLFVIGNEMTSASRRPATGTPTPMPTAQLLPAASVGCFQRGLLRADPAVGGLPGRTTRVSRPARPGCSRTANRSRCCRT